MLKLKPKAKRRGGDIYLLGAVVLLSLIGCVFIYSASSYSAESTYGDAFYFVKKQAIGIALGIVAMLFTANFHYEKLKKSRGSSRSPPSYCSRSFSYPFSAWKTTAQNAG